MKDSLMFSKIKGSIFGAAIGDALGGPLETKTLLEIKERFGTEKVTDLIEYEKPRPQAGNIAVQRGTYTDDTRLRNHLCQAIVEKARRIVARDFARVLLRDMDPSLFWPGEAVVYAKLSLYKMMDHMKHLPNPLSFQILESISARELGRGNLPACDIAMSISPVGLLSPGNPAQAAQDAYEVGSVIQSGYSLAGAACIASATAEAMNPETTLDKVVQVVLDLADEPIKLVLEKALKFAKKVRNVSAYRQWFHQNMLVGFVDVLEVVPAALGIVYIVGDDLNTAVIEAANFGRDCDTIASAVGGILGAFHGIERLPDKWIETVQKANPEPDLSKLSEGVYRALKNEITFIETYAVNLKKYL